MASSYHRRCVHIIFHSSGYFQNFQCKLRCPVSPHLHHRSHRYFASKRQQQESKQEHTSSASSATKPAPHHYSTLNIEPTASLEDIKKAYNNLMKQWHPDLYMNRPPTEQQAAQSKFLSIREAYETITKYKEGATTASSTPSASGKMDMHQAHGQRFQSGFTSGRRVPHASFSYYSWGRKVYETQQRAQQQQADGSADGEEAQEGEEEEEVKYSETYKDKKTWVGRAIEDLYDWMVFLYQRNPVWVQFLMIAAASYSVFQVGWHLLYPHLDDADPDRIWNAFRARKRELGVSGYQPSATASMASTPNLVQLQPYFKEQQQNDRNTMSEEERQKQEKYEQQEFEDVDEESTFTLFAKLNFDSTVNNPHLSIKQKRKKKDRKTGDIEVTVVDADGQKSTEVINQLELDQQNEQKRMEAQEQELEETGSVKKKTKQVKLRRPELKYDDIPVELRSTPMGILLASYAVDSGKLPPMDENGQYDWSEVVEQLRNINEEDMTGEP